jgi:hypothetical protein
LISENAIPRASWTAQGGAGESRQQASSALRAGERFHTALEVIGQRPHEEQYHDDGAAEDRGSDGQCPRRAPGEQPAAQSDADDYERSSVGPVEEELQRQDASRDDAHGEPRGAQRPDRQRYPTGARGCEQLGRHNPRHRDLVARLPSDPHAVAREDRAKERDVGAERQGLEDHPEPEPFRVSRAQPVQSGTERAQLRDDELDEPGDRSDADHRRDRAPVAAQEATSPTC